ncbi:hypothetical protein STENM327S_01939 [Streptomyces tendae]
MLGLLQQLAVGLQDVLAAGPDVHRSLVRGEFGRAAQPFLQGPGGVVGQAQVTAVQLDGRQDGIRVQGRGHRLGGGRGAPAGPGRLGGAQAPAGDGGRVEDAGQAPDRVGEAGQQAGSGGVDRGHALLRFVTGASGVRPIRSTTSAGESRK